LPFRNSAEDARMRLKILGIFVKHELAKWYGGSQLVTINAAQGARGWLQRPPHSKWRVPMSKKIMSTAIRAGLLFALAAPMAQAKSAPKTKA
jgi:hypothetical protein